ncbi:MAG: hypothetical protein AAFR47_20490 [Pseudomonadota bacterium]
MPRLEAAVPAARLHYRFFEVSFKRESIAKRWALLGVEPGPVDLGDRVNEGIATGMQKRSAFACLALEHLAPTYAALQTRCGAALPQSWHRPA